MVQVIYASSYFCPEGPACHSSPLGCWATLGIFFFSCSLGALSHVLGYLKWRHSQSRRRNRSVSLPWPKLSSRWAASHVVKALGGSLPPLLTSAAQGWRQLSPSVQLFRNQGAQAHSQRPSPCSPPCGPLFGSFVRILPEPRASLTFQAFSASWRPQRSLFSGEADGLNCK